MADFCTIMTVVPTGGIDWSPPLGSGATDLCALADAEPLADFVAVAAAVADDAAVEVGVAGPDAALLPPAALDGEPAAVFEPDPPHAASSSTSDPSPVAAANPLLRITSLQFARDGPSPGGTRQVASREEPETRRIRTIKPRSAGTSGARRSAGATDD